MATSGRRQPAPGSGRRGSPWRSSALAVGCTSSSAEVCPTKRSSRTRPRATGPSGPVRVPLSEGVAAPDRDGEGERWAWGDRRQVDVGRRRTQAPRRARASSASGCERLDVVARVGAAAGRGGGEGHDDPTTTTGAPWAIWTNRPLPARCEAPAAGGGWRGALGASDTGGMYEVERRAPDDAGRHAAVRGGRDRPQPRGSSSTATPRPTRCCASSGRPSAWTPPPATASSARWKGRPSPPGRPRPRPRSRAAGRRVDDPPSPSSSSAATAPGWSRPWA